MKKLVCILLTTLLVASFCGCTKTGESSIDSSDFEQASPTQREGISSIEGNDALPQYHQITVEEAAASGVFGRSFSRGSVEDGWGKSLYQLFESLSNNYYKEHSELCITGQNNELYYPAKVVETFLMRSLDIDVQDIRNGWIYNQELNGYLVPYGIGSNPINAIFSSTDDGSGLETITMELLDPDSNIPMGIYSTIVVKKTQWGNQYISCVFNAG